MRPDTDYATLQLQAARDLKRLINQGVYLNVDTEDWIIILRCQIEDMQKGANGTPTDTSDTVQP